MKSLGTLGFHWTGKVDDVPGRRKVGARLGPVLLLKGTMHVLKKGRKRNEPRGEHRQKV